MRYSGPTFTRLYINNLIIPSLNAGSQLNRGLGILLPANPGQTVGTGGIAELLNTKTSQVNFINKLKYPILGAILKVLEKFPTPSVKLSKGGKFGNFRLTGLLGLNSMQASLTNNYFLDARIANPSSANKADKSMLPNATVLSPVREQASTGWKGAVLNKGGLANNVQGNAAKAEKKKQKFSFDENFLL